MADDRATGAVVATAEHLDEPRRAVDFDTLVDGALDALAGNADGESLDAAYKRGRGELLDVEARGAELS